MSDNDPIEMHARLLNWACYFGGGMPNGRRRDPKALDGERTDAELIEQCLLSMRARRPRYWQLVKARYLHRLLDATLCQRERCALTTLRQRFSAVYNWMSGWLEAFDEPMV